MSDLSLISKAAALAALDEIQYWNPEDRYRAKKALGALPPAVEIVRCKDCKNCWKCGWSHSVGDLYGCKIFDLEVRPNDFCSHGERK